MRVAVRCSFSYILVAPTMVLGAALFWFIVYLYRRFFRRSERRTVPELKRIGVTNATVTIIVTLFLLHPSVTEKVLELTTCLEIIPGSGRRFLQANPDVECQTPEHTAWLLAAGLPAFVFIVAGVPVAAFLLLRSLYGSLNERFVKEKYGFLFLGYTRENYYWEIVIVARKVGLSLSCLRVVGDCSPPFPALSRLPGCDHCDGGAAGSVRILGTNHGGHDGDVPSVPHPCRRVTLRESQAVPPGQCGAADLARDLLPGRVPS